MVGISRFRLKSKIIDSNWYRKWFQTTPKRLTDDINMDKLISVLYISIEYEEFDEERLKELEHKAIEHNRRLGISGYLCYDNGYFLQYLEGNKEVVYDLMNTIRKDQRHSILYTMDTEKFSKRLFPSWHMRYLTKPMLGKLGMEESMITYMNFLSKNNLKNIEGWKKNSIWSMVKTLSSLRINL